MAEKGNGFEWKPNLACIATYKVLEGDNNLDQFEESTLPFDKAKNVKLKDLRYYPKTTTNSDILDVVSYEVARKFVKLLVKLYSVKKEKKEVNSGEIIDAVAKVFRNGEKTIGDLAAAVDAHIKFADEN